MGILQLIASRNFITVNKDLIKLLGLEEAVLFGELCSEYDYWEKREELKDGYFFSTIENIEENTTLSEYKQRKAIENLKKANILDIKLMGMPAKRYIKINEEQVLKLFDLEFFNGSSSSSLKIKEQGLEKSKGNNNKVNNNKNNNKNNKALGEVLEQKINDSTLKEVLNEFIEMRKTIKKPLTVRALELLINRLNKLTTNTEEQKEILEQSIMNCWQNIYPLKTETNNKANGGNEGEEYDRYYQYNS